MFVRHGVTCFWFCPSVFDTLAIRSVRIHTHAYYTDITFVRTDILWTYIFGFKSKNISFTPLRTLMQHFKSTFHHWQDGKIIFLLQFLCGSMQIVRGNGTHIHPTALNLNFIKQLSVLVGNWHKLAITNFNWETSFRNRKRKSRNEELELMKVRFMVLFGQRKIAIPIITLLHVLYVCMYAWIKSEHGTVIVVVLST